MPSRCLDTSLRLLLAALLLAGGFSLGIRHAHPGGDRAHHHVGLGHFGLRHHAPGHYDPGACGSTDGEATAAPRRGHSHDIRDHQDLASAPMHRHIYLLGFEFTLTGGTQTPDDSPTDGSRDKIPAAGKDTLVRLVSDDLPNVSAVMLPVALAWHIAVVASPAAILADRPAPRKCCMAAVARPLCDTARHERSGVQLI